MLKTKLDKLDLKFDDLFYSRIEKFIPLLQQWGNIHNLTASLQIDDIEKNIIDSIYPLKFLDLPNNIADIGTGAGYPGLILAIAKPDIEVTLIEPRSKRVAFLNFAKSALKLSNVTILKNRVEDIKDGNFDLITSRAVTNTALLLKITKHISCDKTSFLFYKGSLCENEIKEAQLNNYEVISVGDNRNFLYINKGN